MMVSCQNLLEFEY
jgi:hypothetical protein